MSEQEKRPVGRPRLGKIKLQFAVDSRFNGIIEDLRKYYGITRSELIERLLEKERYLVEREQRHLPKK